MQRTVAILAAALLACGSGSSEKKPVPGDDGSQPGRTAGAAPVELDIDSVDDRQYVLGEDAVLHLSANVAAGLVDSALGADGLLLSGFPADGALAQLGLLPGDVVTRVDGAPLTAIAELRERYTASIDRGRLEIELLRGAARHTRSYHWRSSLPFRARRVPPTWEKADEQLAAALATGIRSVGTDSYEIDSLILRSLADHDVLVDRCHARGNRMRRQQRGVHAPPGPHICAALGIGPYDMIKMVDDVDVSSPASLANALGGLGSARQFTLSILRLSEPRVLRFAVVEDVVMDAQLEQAIAAVEKLVEATPRTGPRRPARPGDPDAGVGRAGARQIGDMTYEVDRALVEQVMAAPSPRDVGRIVPSIRNGKPNGIKVYALRPSGALRAVGIRNGDSIQSVNDIEIRSLDDLQELPRLLSRARRVTVGIERRGKPVELEIRIR